MRRVEMARLYTQNVVVDCLRPIQLALLVQSQCAFKSRRHAGKFLPLQFLEVYTISDRRCHGPILAHICCKSELTLRRTLSQSPGRSWRYSRAVGYQGLSSQLSSQRQQVSNRFKIHTGLPSAPAKCAVAVSTEITKSNR